MARVREMRGGKDYDASFGSRMKGEGVWAQLLQQRLAKARRATASTATAPCSIVTQFKKPAAAQRATARPTLRLTLTPALCRQARRARVPLRP